MRIDLGTSCVCFELINGTDPGGSSLYAEMSSSWHIEFR